MNTIPVSSIMGRYMVRYQRMGELTAYAFKGSRANKVNLFIDLYGLYKTLASRSFRTDISDYTAVTTSVVEICSHYRYFFKRFGVYPSIWIISSYNIPEINRKFVAEYNKTMIEKLATNTQVRDMINLNSQLLEILCPYLPDIYFINTNFESTVVMDAIITREKITGNKNPNIIISNDIYPLQLCQKYDNTVLLYPIKKLGEDNSIITCPKRHPDAFTSFFNMIYRERSQIASDMSEVSISPSNYMLLQALNRFPERNLRNLVSFDQSNRYIANIIKGQDIAIGVDILFDGNPDLDLKVSREIVSSRFKTLDLHYQSMLYTNDKESNLLHYENLSDPEALNMINNKYFKKEPLDLLRL